MLVQSYSGTCIQSIPQVVYTYVQYRFCRLSGRDSQAESVGNPYAAPRVRHDSAPDDGAGETRKRTVK